MGSDPILLLALETATPVISVALLRGDEVIGEAVAPPERNAAQGLLPVVDGVLRECGVSASALSHFAVSVGPGSFTSLRIGIATLKGLAFGLEHRALGISTLEALARAAGERERLVVPLLDAQRGEVYAAGYAVEGSGPEMSLSVAEGVYRPEELAVLLPDSCVVVGEGTRVCGAALREALGPGVELRPGAEIAPHARHVAGLAAPRLAAGEGGDAADLVPRYLRRAEAEVARTGIRFEAAGPRREAPESHGDRFDMPETKE